MRINTIRRGLISAMALSGLLISTGAYAQKKEVTFAHQDMVVPLRVLMESGELEKQTGYKVNWRMFGGGGDVQHCCHAILELAPRRSTHQQLITATAE